MSASDNEIQNFVRQQAEIQKTTEMSSSIEDLKVQKELEAIKQCNETFCHIYLPALTFKDDNARVSALKEFVMAAIANRNITRLDFNSLNLWEMDTKLYAEFANFVETAIKNSKRFTYDISILFWSHPSTNGWDETQKRKYFDMVRMTNLRRLQIGHYYPFPFPISIAEYKDWFSEIARKHSCILTVEWLNNCKLLPDETQQRQELVEWYGKYILKLEVEKLKQPRDSESSMFSVDIPKIKVNRSQELIEHLKEIVLAATNNQKCYSVYFCDLELWDLDLKLYTEFVEFIENALKNSQRQNMDIKLLNTNINHDVSKNWDSEQQDKYLAMLRNVNPKRIIFSSRSLLPFPLSLEEYLKWFQEIMQQDSNIITEYMVKNCLLLHNETERRQELIDWFQDCSWKNELERIRKWSGSYCDARVPKRQFKDDAALFQALKEFTSVVIKNQHIYHLTFTNYDLWERDHELLQEFMQFIEQIAPQKAITLWVQDDIEKANEKWTDSDRANYFKLIRHANLERFSFRARPVPFAISIIEYKNWFSDIYKKSPSQNLITRLSTWAQHCLLLPEERDKRAELLEWFEDYQEEMLLAAIAKQKSKRSGAQETYQLNFENRRLTKERVNKILAVNAALPKIRGIPGPGTWYKHVFQFNIRLHLDENAVDLQMLELLITGMQNAQVTLTLKLDPLEKLNIGILQQVIQNCLSNPVLTSIDLTKNQWQERESKGLCELAHFCSTHLGNGQNVLLLPETNTAFTQDKNIEWDSKNKKEYKERLALIASLNDKAFRSDSFPFPTESQERLEFLLEFIEKYPHRAFKLQNSMHAMNLNTIEIGKLNTQLAKYENESDAPSFYIPLGVVNFLGEDGFSALSTVLSRKKHQFYSFKIDLDLLMPQQLLELVDIINGSTAQNLPQDIEVYDYKITEKGEVEKAILLLERIAHPRLQKLTLFGSFGKLPFATFSQLCQSIAQLDWLQNLDLRNAQLDAFKDNELLEFIEIIKQNKKLTQLHLSGNKLLSRGIPFLSKLAEACVTLPKISELTLFEKYELDSFNLAQLEPNEKKAFINLIKKLMPYDDSHHNCSPFHKHVTIEEEFELLKEFIMTSDNALWKVRRWINNDEFRYEHRYELLRLLELKVTEDYFPLQEYDLKPEDRLNFYLIRMAKTGHSRVYHDGEFLLFDTEIPEAEFLNSWKKCFLATSDREDEGDDQEEAYFDLDEDDFEFDVLKQNLTTQVIPKIKAACHNIFGNNAFYADCLKWIEDQQHKIKDGEHFEIKRWILLLQWFTWSMCYVSRNKIENLSQFSRAFKEIAAFPDPRLRYKLSETLFKNIQHPEGQWVYADLIKPKTVGSIKKKQNKTTSLYIPELFLAEIILQASPKSIETTTAIAASFESASDTKTRVESTNLETKFSCEQSELLKLSHEILSLLPSKYSQGHYLRAFIGALEGLSKAKGMAPKQKLILIHNLLQANPLYLNKEAELKAYFQQLKNKRTINNAILKTELTQLLGESSERLLTPFLQKYFTENKVLELRDLNAIARGVETGWSGLEREAEIRNQMANWYLIQGLSALNEIARLTDLPPHKYRETIYEIFKQIFKVNDTDMKYYVESFSGLRSEAALLSYLSRIRTLNGAERRDIENEIEHFVKGVLTENRSGFLNARYSENLHLHLKTIFTEAPALRELWMQNQTVAFNEFVSENHIDAKSFSPDYQRFYMNKIYNNQHLAPEHYPDLKRYLEINQDEMGRSKIKVELEAELKRLKDQDAATALVFSLKKSKNLTKNAKSILRIELQLKLIGLIENEKKKVSIEVKALAESTQQKSHKIEETKDKKEAIQNQKNESKKCIHQVIKILQQLNEGYEFQNDLQGLLRGFESSSHHLDLTKTKHWTIGFTDNYWDLFLCGTDVDGSCQRVDGSPSLNKCLMAYVLDGKNKMIAIKDETGKIVARAILRLLWDEKEKTPVLFLEESYPHFMAAQQARAIEKFARFLASDLGLTLASSEASLDSIKYPNPLVSLSGVGPEYVDAIHRPAEEGKFTITNAQILFKPQAKIIHQQESSHSGLGLVSTKAEGVGSSSLGMNTPVNTENTVSQTALGLHFTWKKNMTNNLSEGVTANLSDHRKPVKQELKSQ